MIYVLDWIRYAEKEGTEVFHTKTFDTYGKARVVAQRDAQKIGHVVNGIAGKSKLIDVRLECYNMEKNITERTEYFRRGE